MKRRECTRRGFLYLAGLTVAATVTGCSTRFTSQTKKKSNRKPNFVIFFTDDQGYNDVGCFGSPNIKTPNFDRMAGEGMRFADFYAQPVCGPSRAALMTGCYPIRIAEPENIKNQICSVLAGYVWDENNPCVQEHERAVTNLAAACAIMEK